MFGIGFGLWIFVEEFYYVFEELFMVFVDMDFVCIGVYVYYICCFVMMIVIYLSGEMK